MGPHESAQSEDEREGEEMQLDEQMSLPQGLATAAPLLSTNTLAVNAVHSPTAATAADAGAAASPLVICADDSPSHVADHAPPEVNIDSTNVGRPMQAPVNASDLASDEDVPRGPKRLATQSIFGMDDHPPPSKKKRARR